MADGNFEPMEPERESAGDPPPARCCSGWFRLFRRGLVAVALLLVALPAVLLGSNWVWQTWFGPRVDPSQTAPVRITHGGEGSEGGGDAGGPVLTGLLGGLSQAAVDAAPHPLEPVLKIAHEARDRIRSEVRDYTTRMINQVRLEDGQLREEQYLFCKVRHAGPDLDPPVAFSIYTRFLAPQSKLGQEAIWVEGRNDNNLVAHLPAGLTNLLRWDLHPESSLAMAGNRYPIWDIGILRLLDKIIERGERDRKAGPCVVRLDPAATINGAKCILIEVRHDDRRPPYDFHIARIYVDLEREIPVAYEGFLWPEKEGDPPLLLERYVYQDIQTNVGLGDRDFDPDNPEYDYPGRGKKDPGQ